MRLSPRMESACAWACFAYESWRGRSATAPPSPLPTADIRRLGIGPFLYRALRAADDDRSREFAAEYRHTATANLIRLSHGVRIREALAAGGIPCILLKGGAFLVRFSHDDLGVRPMADLDLLVAAEHCDEAAAVLRSCGLTDAVRSRPSRHAAHAWSFTSSSGPIALDIDLHRALASWPMAPALAEGMLERHDVIDGWRVPRLEDACCVTALHRARHGFHWSAVDLFELARTLEAMDDCAWNRLLARAGAADLTGAVWVALRQAAACPGMPQSADRLAALADRTGALQRAVLSRMASPDGLLAPDARWMLPLVRSFVVGPFAMSTPLRAVAAALLFLPLRAADEWTAARQQGLGSAASLRWLWQYAWRGANASGSAGPPEP